MGIRELAKRDAAYIISGDAHGARWPVVVTDPNGKVSSDLYCTSSDISLLIDPQTGQTVSGRQASVTFVTSDLIEIQGFESTLVAVQENQPPWKIQFDDINLNPFTFTVVEAIPDRTFGIIPCRLELYRATR